MRASVFVAHGPSCPLACGILPDRDQTNVSHCCGFFCGTQALRHPGFVAHSMWDPPGPGIKHRSCCPLAGRFVITGPPAKPHKYITYVQSSFHRKPVICVDTKLLTCGCLLRQSIVNIKTMGLWWLVVTYSTPVQWDLVT